MTLQLKKYLTNLQKIVFCYKIFHLINEIVAERNFKIWTPLEALANFRKAKDLKLRDIPAWNYQKLSEINYKNASQIYTGTPSYSWCIRVLVNEVIMSVLGYLISTSYFYKFQQNSGNFWSNTILLGMILGFAILL